MLLEARGLDTYYGPSQVLHGCGIDVARSECLTVLGRNGVGKTTLVHTLGGLLLPRAGRVTFDGIDITQMPSEKRHRAGLTLVPQGHRIFKSLTVAANLSVAERRVDGGWTIDDVYDRFPVLDERAKQLAGSLSGGQQQMLAVGRALVGNGQLVLMDEPSEGLDPQRVALIGDIVRELKARGTSILMVEQRVAFALEVADRVSFMVRGEVTTTMDRDDVVADPDIVTRHLGLVTT